METAVHPLLVTAADVPALALGATLLGGVDDDPAPAEELALLGVPATLARPADLPPGALVLPVAVLGEPVAWSEHPPGPRAITALLARLPHRPDAVLPLRPGALDPCAALAVAAALAVPCLDACMYATSASDPAGTFRPASDPVDAAGEVLLADAAGTVLSLHGPGSSRLVEGCTALLGSAALAAYPCVRTPSSDRSVSRCLEAGRSLLAAGDVPGADLLLAAEVDAVHRAAGRTVIALTAPGDDRVLRLDLDGSRAVLLLADGAPLAAAPDTLLCLDPATARPLAPTALTPGARLQLLSLSAAR